MEAIKKKIASLKKEMDEANEKVETNETKAKQENLRADMIYDEVRDLEKKLVQMEKDFETCKSSLETQSAELERCEKAFSKVSRVREGEREFLIGILYSAKDSWSNIAHNRFRLTILIKKRSNNKKRIKI